MTFLRLLYNFLIFLSWQGLKVIALFNPKIRLFVSGRKTTFQQLKNTIQPTEKWIWMHVASLGEFEQGLPILEGLRKSYPEHKIILTFFSPSGFEVKKNTPFANVTVYLPMDTKSNAVQFLDTVKPHLALFVKYEIWPNYLFELQKRNIPTLLVSAIFSKRQSYFKPWGGFMRYSLKSFAHFFVQDETSKKLLKSIGFENVTVSGDTRFDRVSQILENNNSLSFMDSFKGNSPCMVAGSTWPEDEKILLEYINTVETSMKFVIAPHEIKTTHIEKITNTLTKKVVCYSQKEIKNLNDFDVMIIDTIGLLTKIYSYADISYVGGAFATGLHNTLEPATFGVPIIIGPDYEGFKEAEDLVDLKGIHPIANFEEFSTVMNIFVSDASIRKENGQINATYVQENQGATTLILKHIKTFL
ncbi:MULTISPECIES: 3-deoxy-D-manno-octulosonic acid transferase [Flavobacteriaceae]|uniref:3-deoxy-D-manno-octulosonic acid transferase n=1 Tax=Flavobacteriaceae TaxID=49546 RepID=UPI0028BD5D91|nr:MULTISPECIES: glycosyltransferase N-terminal domain-containing protein [Allomuricauda]